MRPSLSTCFITLLTTQILAGTLPSQPHSVFGLERRCAKHCHCQRALCKLEVCYHDDPVFQKDELLNKALSGYFQNDCGQLQTFVKRTPEERCNHGYVKADIKYQINRARLHSTAWDKEGYYEEVKFDNRNSKVEVTKGTVSGNCTQQQTVDCNKCSNRFDKEKGTCTAKCND